ncbi:MAG: hypothetical protein IT449_07825 [Phycisphaerales bacterium]|nr:hypothetical protein [Phycisphaerales bacterium]
MADAAPAPAPPAAVSAELAKRFRLNGYVRRPNAELRAEAPDHYKKGYEIRLVADSQVELREVRRLLRAAGFEPGRPFAKSNQWRQPVYGRAAVMRFLRIVGAKSPPKRVRAKSKSRRGSERPA